MRKIRNLLKQAGLKKCANSRSHMKPQENLEAKVKLASKQMSKAQVQNRHQ